MIDNQYKYCKKQKIKAIVVEYDYNKSLLFKIFYNLGIIQVQGKTLTNDKGFDKI